MGKPYLVKTKAFKISLLGGETLLGHELQEVVENRGTGAVITVYASSGEGNFSEQEGEAIYLEPLQAEAIRGDRAVLIAGSAEGARKAYQLAKAGNGHPPIIDCTEYLENQPEARIVAPLVEKLALGASWLLIVAHPAASALCLVLSKLARYRGIRRVVAEIFEPASERGKRGVSELHQQTTSLLGFKTLEKSVFDAQLAFNILPQFGEAAPRQLSTVEQRIETHVATILGRLDSHAPVPMPSIRLIQAPVFHGYSFSLWVEFESDIDAKELGETLASAQIEVRGQDEEAPTNAGVTSQSGLIVGDIRVDRNMSRAAWLWMVGDNLRITADGAADLLNALGEERQ